MKDLVVASGNAGKLKEIKELMKGVYNVVSMKDIGFTGDIEETGETFYENALIKAKAVSEKFNVDALGDDSGLCVECLNGAPGVYSARYSGEHGNDKQNRLKLLEELKNEKNRKAKFVTVMVLYKNNGETVTATGETHGVIDFKETGENGFGYDSVFISDDLKKSFGEATAEEKNSVSHRARAIKNLLLKL